MSQTMALRCMAGVWREEGAFNKHALIEEACPSLQLFSGKKLVRNRYFLAC